MHSLSLLHDHIRVLNNIPRHASHTKKGHFFIFLALRYTIKSMELINIHINLEHSYIICALKPSIHPTIAYMKYMQSLSQRRVQVTASIHAPNALGGIPTK